MSELVAAEERVRTLVAAARRRNEGFKAVCEKLGVDAEEADGLITEFVPDPSDDAVVMHALLVGVLAGEAREGQRVKEALEEGAIYFIRNPDADKFTLVTDKGEAKEWLELDPEVIQCVRAGPRELSELFEEA